MCGGNTHSAWETLITDTGFLRFVARVGFLIKSRRAIDRRLSLHWGRLAATKRLGWGLDTAWFHGL